MARLPTHLLDRLLLRLVVGCIRLYQLCLSPFLAPSCRFHPNCSEYAVSAIRAHGLIGGGRRSLRRLLRCRPGGGMGYDPLD